MSSVGFHEPVDDEKEHAARVLAWIRRKDPTFSKELKGFLFTTKPLAHP